MSAGTRWHHGAATLRVVLDTGVEFRVDIVMWRGDENDFEFQPERPCPIVSLTRAVLVEVVDR